MSTRDLVGTSSTLLDYFHAAPALGLDIDPMSPADQDRVDRVAAARGVTVQGIAQMVLLDTTELNAMR